MAGRGAPIPQMQQRWLKEHEPETHGIYQRAEAEKAVWKGEKGYINQYKEYLKMGGVQEDTLQNLAMKSLLDDKNLGEAGLLALPMEERQKLLDEATNKQRAFFQEEALGGKFSLIRGLKEGAHLSGQDLVATEEQRSAIQEGTTAWNYSPAQALAKMAQVAGNERGLQLYGASLDERQRSEELKNIAMDSLFADYGEERITSMPQLERSELFDKTYRNLIDSTIQTNLSDEEKAQYTRYRKDRYGVDHDWQDGSALSAVGHAFLAPAQATVGALAGAGEVALEHTANQEPAHNVGTILGSHAQRIGRDLADDEATPEDDWKHPTRAALRQMGGNVLGGSLQALGGGVKALSGGEVMGVSPAGALSAIATGKTDIAKRSLSSAWEQFKGNNQGEGSFFQFAIKAREKYVERAKEFATQNDIEPTKENLSKIAKEFWNEDSASLQLNNPTEAQYVAEFAFDPLNWLPVGKAAKAGGRAVGKLWEKIPWKARRMMDAAARTGTPSPNAVRQEVGALGKSGDEFIQATEANRLRSGQEGVTIGETLSNIVKTKLHKKEKVLLDDVIYDRVHLEDALQGLKPKRRQNFKAALQEVRAYAKEKQVLRESIPEVGEQFVNDKLVSADARKQAGYLPQREKRNWFEDSTIGKADDSPGPTTKMEAASEHARGNTPEVYKQDPAKQIGLDIEDFSKAVERKGLLAKDIKTAQEFGVLKHVNTNEAFVVKEGVNVASRAKAAGVSAKSLHKKILQDATRKAYRESGMRWKAVGFETLRGSKGEVIAAEAGESLYSELVKGHGLRQVNKAEDFFLVPTKGIAEHFDKIGRLATPSRRKHEIAEYAITSAKTMSRLIMDPWRAIVTVGRGIPYATRNAMFAQMVPMVSGGASGIKPSLIRDSLLIMAKANVEAKAFKTIMKRPIKLKDGTTKTLGDMYKILRDHGFLGQHFERLGVRGNLTRQVLENITPTGIPLPAVGPLKAVSSANVARMTEDYQKIATFMTLIEGSSKKAVNKAVFLTKKWAGHMKDLTSFERNVVREVLPFYAFFKYSSVATVKGATHRPALYASFVRARNYKDKVNSNKYNPYMKAGRPTWARNNSYTADGRFQTEDGSGKVSYTLTDTLFDMAFKVVPLMESIYKGETVAGDKFLRDMVGLAPVAQYELLTGRDYTTDQRISDIGMTAAEIMEARLSSVRDTTPADIEQAHKMLVAGHPALKALTGPVEPLIKRFSGLAKILKVFQKAGAVEEEMDLKTRLSLARSFPTIAAALNAVREARGEDAFAPVDVNPLDMASNSTYMTEGPEVTMSREQRRKIGRVKSQAKYLKEELHK